MTDFLALLHNARAAVFCAIYLNRYRASNDPTHLKDACDALRYARTPIDESTLKRVADIIDFLADE